jgi:uncharacterized protein YuzE
VEAIRILEKKENLNWEYDEEADVLYISIGEPVEAVGLDVGDGVIVRYREDTAEMVGITLIGVRERSLTAMARRK